MWITTDENLTPRGVSGSNFADVKFADLGARGITAPMLQIKLQARATHVSDPNPQHSIQPMRLVGELYLGTDSDAKNLIAVGEASYPLSEWQAYRDASVTIEFPLTPPAVDRIVGSLRDNYVNAVVEIAGFAEYRSTGIENFYFQVKKEPLHFKPSVIDWNTKVLEPIGWNKHILFSFPVPTYGPDGEFFEIARELRLADDAYLRGDDASVFAHVYNAWDPFIHASREDVASKAAGENDGNKKGTILQLITTVKRLANGGRHLPESRSSQGGFPVDHIDSEYLRALAHISVAYLAKRLHSNEKAKEL